VPGAIAFPGFSVAALIRQEFHQTPNSPFSSVPIFLALLRGFSPTAVSLLLPVLNSVVKSFSSLEENSRASFPSYVSFARPSPVFSIVPLCLMNQFFLLRVKKILDCSSKTHLSESFLPQIPGRPFTFFQLIDVMSKGPFPTPRRFLS